MLEVPQSAVVSVILGDPDVAVAAATACLDAGVRVGCFRPPTVPAGTSRLRLTARASLDADELEVARRVLTDVLVGLGWGTPVTVLVVTGTDTGVGKTVVTAALACHARQAGIDVAVCKPVQTGTDSGDDDLAEVGRLSGVTELARLARYPQPLAPWRGRAGRDVVAHPRAVPGAHREAGPAGAPDAGRGRRGLLVELGENGVTARDLAVALGAAVLVVVSPSLGTLNHTALTLESLAAHNLSCAGLVIGAWPEHPGIVETSNRSALARLAPVRAALPEGAASLDAAGFAALCATAFDRDWIATLAG